MIKWLKLNWIWLQAMKWCSKTKFYIILVEPSGKIWYGTHRTTVICAKQSSSTALLEPIVCKSCGFSGGEASWLALVRSCELPSWLHSASCDWYFYNALDSHMKFRGWLTQSRSKSGVQKGKCPVSGQAGFWKFAGLPYQTWCPAEPYLNTSKISLMHIFKVNC